MVTHDDLKRMTVRQLKARIKQHNITGYGKMRKAELIRAIALKEGIHIPAIYKKATARKSGTKPQTARTTGAPPKMERAIHSIQARKKYVEQKAKKTTPRLPRKTLKRYRDMFKKYIKKYEKTSLEFDNNTTIKELTDILDDFYAEYSPLETMKQYLNDMDTKGLTYKDKEFKYIRMVLNDAHKAEHYFTWNRDRVEARRRKLRNAPDGSIWNESDLTWIDKATARKSGTKPQTARTTGAPPKMETAIYHAPAQIATATITRPGKYDKETQAIIDEWNTPLILDLLYQSKYRKIAENIESLIERKNNKGDPVFTDLILGLIKPLGEMVYDEHGWNYLIDGLYELIRYQADNPVQMYKTIEGYRKSKEKESIVIKKGHLPERIRMKVYKDAIQK